MKHRVFMAERRMGCISAPMGKADLDAFIEATAVTVRKNMEAR